MCSFRRCHFSSAKPDEYQNARLQMYACYSRIGVWSYLYNVIPAFLSVVCRRETVSLLRIQQVERPAASGAVTNVDWSTRVKLTT